MDKFRAWKSYRLQLGATILVVVVVGYISYSGYKAIYRVSTATQEVRFFDSSAELMFGADQRIERAAAHKMMKCRDLSTLDNSAPKSADCLSAEADYAAALDAKKIAENKRSQTMSQEYQTQQAAKGLIASTSTKPQVFGFLAAALALGTAIFVLIYPKLKEVLQLRRDQEIARGVHRDKKGFF